MYLTWQSVKGDLTAHAQKGTFRCVCSIYRNTPLTMFVTFAFTNHLVHVLFLREAKYRVFKISYQLSTVQI